MKSFYSIVYSTINSVSQERLNLGMIMLDENKNVTFRYSQEKLKAVSKLFSEDAFKLIKTNLKALDNKVSNKGDLINNLESFNQEYLGYLSNYSNNLIAYSKPTPIAIELTESNFTKLFEKFVHKMPEPDFSILVDDKAYILEVKRNFILKVKKRVNIDVELKADEFDFVMFNTHVDMMGKNDRPVLNQFVDFKNKSKQTLENNIKSYLSLIKPLEIKDGKEGKYFLVGEEPEIEQTKLVWKHLNDSPLVKKKVVEIVNPNETEQIEEYLEEHDVQPYFEIKD